MSDRGSNFKDRSVTMNFRSTQWARDGKAIADTLGLDIATTAGILGVDFSTFDRGLLAPEARERVALLQHILSMLEELYGDLDYAVAWLKTPSYLWAETGDLSALDLIAKEAWGMELVYQTVGRLFSGEPDL